MVAISVILLLLGCPNSTTPIPPTTATPDTVISITEIPGVTAPVTGATPVTAITETEQYTGTVTWSGTPATFAASTVYTATITLTAKAGYTLTGVVANSFAVAGATATNSVNSGVITAVFPVTGLGLTMIYVPAGTFQRDATVTNTSTVSSFRMSQHEITRAQFQTIMGTDPSNTTSSSGTTDPVQSVNWYHVIAFCNKLSLAEGLTPVYSVIVNSIPVNWSSLTYADVPTSSNANWNATVATWANNGYRLPTEMEWMWAAMGAPSDGQAGGTNTTGYLKGYAGSTEGASQTNIGNYAWYSSNSGNKSHPVGVKQANELGLYDMSGNVFEWCWDWTGGFPSGAVTDYRGATTGSIRALYGGCWSADAIYCKVDYLYGNCTPDYRNGNFGFRVVRL